ncbi:hypothetical protein QPK24_09985 [Paenibacillus polygoni]|uniref:Phospholipid phosphatase n=1 Tax=Paenibacillus polygoni TaxID=3050112 RepID=A0ABY8XCD6_9BACL|nr:hypothetical protein [Paenibacillus polygoni]WIV20965.1 hypothetical protein QPK24_09985 [Paenibacillus polygoni]
MDFWIYSIITIAYIILLLFMFTHLSRTRRWFHYPILLVILALGLAYDNGIIAAGNAIGEGKTLMVLSSLRFWIHAFVTPGLVLVGYYILQRSGAAIASKTYIRISAWIITLALILYQIFAQTLHEVKNLQLVKEYGVLRYAAEGTSGPPIMVIVVGIILLIVGTILIFRQKWIWMFVGTALLFIGQLIPLPFESSAATNIFELILIISLWITIWFQDHKNDARQFKR